MAPRGIRRLVGGLTGLTGALGAWLAGVWLATGCELLVGIPNVSLASSEAGEAGASGTGSDDAGACMRASPGGAVRAGPAMVLVDAPLGGYCIDTTEVTVAQFNAYLLDSGVLVAAPAGCTEALDDGSLAPPSLVDNDSQDQDLPVGEVGECYAGSYCRWASKRLCGRVGDGGTVSASDPAETTEWGYACANGKQNTAYPYGQSYDASVCNTEGSGPVPVASKSGCHGMTPPFDRIFDLSGNAWELVNDLTPTNASADPWGGAWNSHASASCTPSGAFNGYVFNPEPSGFRCCADAP